MKNEDPPNKEVHAEDLAAQLAKLTGKMSAANPGDQEAVDTGASYTREQMEEIKTARPMIAIPEGGSSGEPHSAVSSTGGTRSRSSTVIYDPGTHGDSPALPAVKVEDYTMNDGDVRLDSEAKKITAHTSRPPVELMNDS